MLKGLQSINQLLYEPITLRSNKSALGIRRTESIDDNEFQPSSLTYTRDSCENKREEASISKGLQVVRESTLQSEKSLNQSQRKLVSSMAKLFIADQHTKPEKVLIRINQMADVQRENQKEGTVDKCRITKIEICKMEKEQGKGISSTVVKGSQQFIEVTGGISGSKILVSREINDSMTRSAFVGDRTKISSPCNFQRKSQIKQKGPVVLSLVKTVSIGYMPYFKPAFYSKFKKNPLNQMPSTLKKTLYDEARMQANTELDDNDCASYSTLKAMENFLLKSIYFNKSLQHSEAVQKITLEQYQSYKQSHEQDKRRMKSYELKVLEESRKVSDQLARSKKEIEDLKLQINSLNISISNLKTINKDYEEKNKKLMQENQQFKKSWGMLKKQLAATNQASIASSQLKKKDSERLKNHPYYQDEDLATPPLKRQQQSLTLKLISTGTFKAPVDTVRKTEPCVLRANFGQQSTERIFIPNGSVVIQNEDSYYRMVNPTLQYELRRDMEMIEMRKKGKQEIGIRKNTPTSTPVQQSRKILRGHKSTDHIYSDNDWQKRSQDNLSSSSKKSLTQRVGYIKKTPVSNAKDSMLIDYMLTEFPSADEETTKAASHNNKVGKVTSEIESEKKPFLNKKR